MSENDATTKGIRLVGKNLLFGSVAVIFFFLVLEIAARVVGFDEPVRFQVLAKGKSERFENSDLLGWEPIKVSGDFNEDGFIGPRVPKERTPGVLRIAALGDSCTQWGDPPYPELLRARLETSVGATEALNAGVAGYSSTQGRIHFQHDVLPYRPDIVTIYFGWNDHWTKNAHTDSEIFDPARNAPWKKASAQRLAEIRVIQIGFFLKELVVGNRWPLVLRVPLREYRKNLNEMVEQVRDAGALPILITAPSDCTPATDPPLGLIRLENIGYDNIKDVHDDYIDATRDVAEETRCILVDAHQAFGGQGAQFEKDHIHLTQQGREFLTELLARAILENRQSWRIHDSPQAHDAR